MKIRLLNFLRKNHWVDIPDDTEEIKIKIISGDMVLVSPFIYDTGENDRTWGFYDGTYTIKKDQFEKLNKLTDSYRLWELTSI